MAQVINTNILSLNAQRNLNSSQGALQTSLQRLSSGLRINSAKDDAAGLAISERFTTQIRGLNQAIRNSNDGISLAQTAEGALAEVTNNLQRIRELAVQSRNATNSATDRQALDAEVQQRILEINRIASQTQFNGLQLLDGSFTTQVFQVGANQGQTISVAEIGDTTTANLGIDDGFVFGINTVENGGTLSGVALAAGNLTLNGSDVGAVASDALLIADAINALGLAGITAEATASTSGATGAFTTTVGGTYSLVVGGVEVLAPTVAGVTDANIDTAVGLATAALNTAGITVSGTAVLGTLEFSRADGGNVVIEQIAGAGFSAGGFANLTTPVASSTVTDTFSGTVDLTHSVNVVVAGASPTAAGFTAGTLIADTDTDGVNVLTASAADQAIASMDDALTIVNGIRADLGAVQNRFESVIASLATTAENLTASRSRIMDTDFAAETAALTRAQILQQAGIAILAQANAQPQNVLALLR